MLAFLCLIQPPGVKSLFVVSTCILFHCLIQRTAVPFFKPPTFGNFDRSYSCIVPPSLVAHRIVISIHSGTLFLGGIRSTRRFPSLSGPPPIRLNKFLRLRNCCTYPDCVTSTHEASRIVWSHGQISNPWRLRKRLNRLQSRF